MFADETSVLKDRKLWARVAEYVEGGDMPPEGKPQPSPEEVELISGWIDAKLSSFDCGLDADPGRVTLRRLNRAEYNNTIRDLVGVDFRPADDFPTDDVGYGFDNIGDVLSLSADPDGEVPGRRRDDRREGDRRRPPAPGDDRRYAAEEMEPDPGTARVADSACLLFRSGKVAVSHAFPGAGEYRLRVRAFGHQAGRGAGRMTVEIDGRPVGTFDVVVEEDRPQDYEARASVPAGRHRISVAFVNDYYDPDNADPKRRDRNLVVDSVEVRGPVGGGDAPLPESHRRIIFRTPSSPEDQYECGRAIIERFASRAYRRPVTTAEVARLFKLVDLVQSQGDSFERGIQLAVQAVLASPQFLFRVELDPRRKFRTDPGPPPRTRSTTSSSPRGCRTSSGAACPTTSSRTWPSRGKLREGDNLEAQVRRMLQRPEDEGPGRELRRPVAPDPPAEHDQPRPRRCSPRSTTPSARRCSARPSCSSSRSCATTGACSTSSTPTTPSSTSGWRSTTGSRGSRGTSSAGSR